MLQSKLVFKFEAVSVQITILGSGSSGNCAYIETEQSRLLIDAGLSGRQIRNRLLSIGRTIENLTGILITHEHSDHVQGLTALAGKISAPIYCNRLTKEAIELQLGIKCNFQIFATGASFETGDLVIDTFSVPHDAYDPVGFLIRAPDGNVAFLTDLGHPTKLVIQRVRAAHVLFLESNHDMKMLQDDTRRPWSIKQRILSRHGHLSNEAAALAVQEILSDDLQRIYLGHLSSDCNRPELAQYVVAEVLEKAGAKNIPIVVASQDIPCPTYTLQVMRKPAAVEAPYEIRTNGEPIFEQAELFTEQTVAGGHPVRAVQQMIPPRQEWLQ